MLDSAPLSVRRRNMAFSHIPLCCCSSPPPAGKITSRVSGSAQGTAVMGLKQGGTRKNAAPYPQCRKGKRRDFRSQSLLLQPPQPEWLFVHVGPAIPGLIPPRGQKQLQQWTAIKQPPPKLYSCP